MNVKTNNMLASLAKTTSGERVIKISFPYDMEMICKIRTIQGRKYHSDVQCWSAPFFPETITQLASWGFPIDDSLKEFMHKRELRAQEITKIGIPGLLGELFPFQNSGVAFIENNKGKALIADEMGLGKTVQALAWLQLHRNLRPAIIVVPASLKLNWKREAEKWLPDPNVEILNGTSTWIPTGDIIIINYDVLHAWTSVIDKLEPAVLVTDECHLYKSNKAQRTKAIKKIGKKIPHVIALSGTPIVNRPVEAYNAIHLINPDLFPSYWNFTKMYCDARQTRFGWDLNGASRTEELHNILKNTIMLRRLKKDVLPDLPDKIYSFTPIELDNEADYRFAERDFIAFIRREKGAEAAERVENAKILASIEGLKQLAVKGKLHQAIEWIDNFLEVSDKLVVFATHKFVIDALMKAFDGVTVKIDGGVTQRERQKAVDEFQNNPKVKLFVGNIQAAGVGITLTAASNVAFIELPWTPGALVQAEDRCHRIGQKDSVNVHYLLASNTIEEKIAHLLDKKRKVLDAVLDGKETETESLLSELMKEYK